MVLVANKWDLKNEHSVSEDKIDQVAKNMNVIIHYSIYSTEKLSSGFLLYELSTTFSFTSKRFSDRKDDGLILDRSVSSWANFIDVTVHIFRFQL